MKGLQKIWYCPKCEFFFVTPHIKLGSTCPQCKQPVDILLPSRILEKEKVAVPIEEIQLGAHSYKFIKKIGTGGFGVIYMVQDENDNYYALKLPKTFIDLVFAKTQESSVDSHTRRTLLKQNDAIGREVKVLSKHYFSKMMPLIDYGNFEFGGQTVDFFVQELGYASLTELLEWGMQNQFMKKWETRYWFAYEVAKAVAEAHSNGILLRDLSTENVMLTINETNGIAIKLIDFGGAKTETMSSMLVYRNLYVPPLLLSEKGKKRDVFNLGILLFEILTNSPHWINLIGDISDFQEDEFHRMLSNFEQEIIMPFSKSIPLGDGRNEALQVIRKAISIDKNGKYNGFEDANELLERLPPATKIPATVGKIMTLNLSFDLADLDNTQEVLLIDKFVEENEIEAKNTSFIMSKNYKIKLLDKSEIFRKKDEQTFIIDIPARNLKYLPSLNAKLFLSIKIEVVA